MTVKWKILPLQPLSVLSFSVFSLFLFRLGCSWIFACDDRSGLQIHAGVLEETSSLQLWILWDSPEGRNSACKASRPLCNFVFEQTWKYAENLRLFLIASLCCQSMMSCYGCQSGMATDLILLWRHSGWPTCAQKSPWQPATHLSMARISKVINDYMYRHEEFQIV